MTSAITSIVPLLGECCFLWCFCPWLSQNTPHLACPGTNLQNSMLSALAGIMKTVVPFVSHNGRRTVWSPWNYIYLLYFLIRWRREGEKKPNQLKCQLEKNSEVAGRLPRCWAVVRNPAGVEIRGDQWEKSCNLNATEDSLTRGRNKKGFHMSLFSPYCSNGVPSPIF